MSQETVIRCDGRIESEDGEAACPVSKTIDRGYGMMVGVEGFGGYAEDDDEWVTVVLRPETGNRSYQFCPKCGARASGMILGLLSRETIEREMKMDMMREQAYEVPMRIRRARRQMPPVG